jgi:hypothetical protein
MGNKLTRTRYSFNNDKKETRTERTNSSPVYIQTQTITRLDSSSQVSTSFCKLINVFIIGESGAQQKCALTGISLQYFFISI